MAWSIKTSTMAKSFDSVKKCCPRTTLLPQDFIYLYFISIRRWNFSFELHRNPNFIEKISQNNSHIFIVVWLHNETKFCKVPLQWNISSKKSHLFCRIKRLELVLKGICCLKTNDNPKNDRQRKTACTDFSFWTTPNDR